MEGSSNFNDIVADPLTKDSNEDWFEWVKNYLISQDLWKVTRSSAGPERYRVKDFARWRRKNAEALHIIRISCGPDNHSLIRGASKAKVAWDILYRTYKPESPPQAMKGAEEMQMSILYKAISENNWSAAKAFIDGNPRVLNVEFATSISETPLHVAAKFGNVRIVEELVRLVPPEYLQIPDAADGFTPLLVVASHGEVIPIAKCLVDKNPDALEIPTRSNKSMIPVTLALNTCLNKMGRYLYSVTPLHVFKPENGPMGPRLVRTCFITGELDIVLDLLQRCKQLLFAAYDGLSTMEQIAFHLPNSLDKRDQLPFWKRWVYHSKMLNYDEDEDGEDEAILTTTDIKIPSTTTVEHFCVDIQQECESNKAHSGVFRGLISSIYNLSGMKEIYKMKLQHEQAAKILNLACENLISLNEEKKKMIEHAMFSAATVDNNVEFLLRVTKANPELISLVTFGQQNMPLFFDAVKYRQAEISNLLRGFRFKNAVAEQVTENGNNLLHMAALLAPASQLNRISGAALKTQRELQWFKAVESSMVDPRIWHFQNYEGLNPVDLFIKNHKEHRDEGEKWMKQTASSCSVVGALIVTIMFAAAFTVPGGNDQNSGYPIFLEERLFEVFLISDALSLFSSTTSVLTFLGILTSRYAEEDFLYSLPKKLIIGLSTLFLSIATMMMAFSATIIIMLRDNSSRLWAFLPIIMLAGVPVTLFVLLQYPLLAEVSSSTYDRGLFKKKVQMWP